ncbi:MAG TPA: VWA domain-containing protein [Terriglobia bacterium]|nr:VWA domain-containing protein [Terriglobia bacterium]
MALTLETYWPFLLLAFVPVIWRLLRSTSVDLSPAQLRLCALIRSAIVALLTLALAQPAIQSQTTRISVVYLLDVSQSVAPSAIEQGLEWIRQTNESGRPDHAQFVAFGANGTPFKSVDDLRQARLGDRSADARVIDPVGTDIAGAIRVAVGSLAPDHIKRIALLSDGNENAGNLSAELTRLKAEGIRVFTLPMASRADRDVWVEAVERPEVVTTEEQFPVEVVIYSQAAMTAEVELRTGAGKILGTKVVRLSEGINRASFETRVSEESGARILAAVVKPAEDVFSQNNVYDFPLVVSGQPQILYAEGRAESAKYLRDALTGEGLHVQVVEPASIPASVAGLDRYDAVVLSDIDGKLLGSGAMRSLERYVRELGGGLVLAGGENVYGEGGYSRTPIEEALPATFDVSRKKPPTVAMIVVMDNSNSMIGQKLELAKAAAKAPLELLRDTDHFGLNTFSTGPVNWVVPLTPAGDRAGIARSISTIDVSRIIGTDAFACMEAAFDALNKATDEIKTILFLTDGQMTVRRDYHTLTRRMREAGIQVTTVAIGGGADRELLTDLAMVGKGRAYYLQSANNVPQIFMRETELSMDKALREETFNVLVKKDVEAFKGIDFNAAPNLLGYLVTKPKPTAAVLLAEAIGGDPVLSRWQHGLGKTVLFASDLKDRWAVNWLSWGGYRKFWSQLIRDTMRRDNENFDFSVERDGPEAVITFEAITADGSYLNGMAAEARMIGPDQQVVTISLPQSAPGLYRARIPVRSDSAYLFRPVVDGASGPARALASSYPAEYHFYPPDLDRLRAISRETGGQFQPDPASIFDPAGDTAVTRLPLWPWISALALVLLITDILLRRLRLFEGESPADPA